MRFVRLLRLLLPALLAAGSLLAAAPAVITADAPVELALSATEKKAELTFTNDGTQLLALRIATDAPAAQVVLSFSAKADFGDLKLENSQSWTFEAASARSQLFDRLPQFPATWNVTASLRGAEACRLTLQLESQGAAPDIAWGGESGTLLVRNAGQSRLRVEPESGVQMKHPLLRGPSIGADTTPEGDALFRLPAGHWNLVGTGEGAVRNLRSALIPISSGGRTVVDWPQMRAVEGEQSKGLDQLTLRDATADGGTGTLLVAAPMFAETPKPEAIRVLEGGQRGEVLSVEAIPAKLHVVVLFDSSFSMRKIFGEAQAAALRFVEKLPPETTFDFFDFDTKVRELPANDREALLAAIREIKADGSTKLNDSIVKGLAKCEGHRRSAVVVFTDGFDARVDDVGHGSRATEEQVFDAVAKAQVPLFTIAYGEKPDEQTLQRLAAESGGAYFRAQADTVGGVFDEIAGLVDRDYRIRYRRPAMVAANNTPFITFMVDVSGSMNETPRAGNPGRRFDRAKDVLRPFFARLPEGAVVQLFTYSENVTLVQTPTADRPRLLRALATAGTGGGTETLNAITASWASLQKVPSRNRSLVFVTDAALHIAGGNDRKLFENTLAAMKAAEIRSLWVGMVPESGAKPFAEAAALSGGTHVVSPGVESLAQALASLEKSLAAAEASNETAVEILIDKIADNGAHKLHGGTGLFPLPPSGSVCSSAVTGLAATVDKAPQTPDPTIAPKPARTRRPDTVSTAPLPRNAAAPDAAGDLELNRVALGQSAANEAVEITVHEARFYSRLHGFEAPKGHRIVELAVTLNNILPEQKVFIPEKGSAHPASWVGTGKAKGKTIVAVPPYLLPDLRRHLFLRWNDGVETAPSLLSTLDPEPLFRPDAPSVCVSPGTPRTGRLVFLVEGEGMRSASLHLYDTAYRHAEIALVGPVAPRAVPLAELPTRATGKLSDAFTLNLLGHSDTPEAIATVVPGAGNVFRTVQLGLESKVQALLNLPPARSFELLLHTNKGPVATELAPLTEALPGSLYRAPTLVPGAHNRFQQLYCLPAALAAAPSALFVEVKGEDVVLPLAAPLPTFISTSSIEPADGLGITVNALALASKEAGLTRPMLAADVTITDAKDAYSTSLGNHFVLVRVKEPGGPFVDPDAPTFKRKLAKIDNQAEHKGLGSFTTDESEKITPHRVDPATGTLLFGLPVGSVIPDGATRRGVLLFSPPTEGEWVLAFRGRELARLTVPAPPMPTENQWLLARRPAYPQLNDRSPEALVAKLVDERVRTGWFKELARASTEPATPVVNPEGDIVPVELDPPSLTFAGAQAWQQLLAEDEAALWRTIAGLRVMPSTGAPWASALAPETVMTQGAGSIADLAELARQWYFAQGLDARTQQAALSAAGQQLLGARIPMAELPKAIPVLKTASGTWAIPFGLGNNEAAALFAGAPTEAKPAPHMTNVVVSLFCKPAVTNAAAQMGNMASALGGGGGTKERRFTLWSGRLPTAELSQDALDVFFYETGGKDSELRVQTTLGVRVHDTKAGSGVKSADWVPVREVIEFSPPGRDPVRFERFLDDAPIAGTCHTIAIAAPDLPARAAEALAVEWAKRQATDQPNHRSIVRWLGRSKIARFLAAQTLWEEANARDLGVALSRADRARVLVATIGADPDGKPRQSFDLARSEPAVLGEAEAANAFRAMHGLADTAFEGRPLGGHSVTDIWTRRGDYIGVTPKQRKAFATDLAKNKVPAEVVEAVRKGDDFLLFARRPLLVGGRPLWGWLEIDGTTYETRSVFSTGEHGMVESVINYYTPNAGSYTIGYMVGVDASIWGVCAFTLDGLKYEEVLAKAEEFALGLAEHLSAVEEPSYSPEDGPVSIGTGGLSLTFGPVTLGNDGLGTDEGGFSKFSDGYKAGVKHYFKRAKRGQ